MNKKTMKKFIVGALTLALFGVATYALADQVTAIVQEARAETALSTAVEAKKQSRTEKTDKELKKLIDDKKLIKTMEKQGYYADDIEITIGKYLEAVEIGGMTEEELDYILYLAKLDYDIEQLLDIYNFLTMTDSDISVLREVYDVFDEDMKDTPHWIENAYAIVRGITGNELSKDEIFAYISKGISEVEFVGVYEMSLKGNCTEREMLDMHINGKPWSEIAALAYNDETLAQQFDAETELSTITSYAMMARGVGEKLSDAVIKENGKVKIKDKHAENYFAKHDKAKGVMKNYAFNMQSAYAALPNMDAKLVDALVQDGYRIKDIQKAVGGKSNSKACNEIREKVTAYTEGGEGR